ncbi:hypothetical protein K439DRAFT_1624615 [Ramaria rubella]|nr:hypothetical protein K439DRAFT_1624615 [Ramaria rubella]
MADLDQPEPPAWSNMLDDDLSRAPPSAHDTAALAGDPDRPWFLWSNFHLANIGDSMIGDPSVDRHTFTLSSDIFQNPIPSIGKAVTVHRECHPTDINIRKLATMNNSQLQGLMWCRRIPVLLLQDRRSPTTALIENGGLSFDLDYFFGCASVPGWLPFLPTAPQHLRYLLTLEPRLPAGFFKDKHTILRFDMDGKYIRHGKDTAHNIYMAFIPLMSQHDDIDFLIPLGSHSLKPMSTLRRASFFVFLSVTMMLAGAMPPPNQPWTTDSVKVYTTLPSVASLNITYAQAIAVNREWEAAYNLFAFDWNQRHTDSFFLNHQAYAIVTRFGQACSMDDQNEFATNCNKYCQDWVIDDDGGNPLPIDALLSILPPQGEDAPGDARVMLSPTDIEELPLVDLVTRRLIELYTEDGRLVIHHDSECHPAKVNAGALLRLSMAARMFTDPEEFLLEEGDNSEAANVRATMNEDILGDNAPPGDRPIHIIQSQIYNNFVHTLKAQNGASTSEGRNTVFLAGAALGGVAALGHMSEKWSRIKLHLGSMTSRDKSVAILRNNDDTRCNLRSKMVYSVNMTLLPLEYCRGDIFHEHVVEPLLAHSYDQRYLKQLMESMVVLPGDLFPTMLGWVTRPINLMLKKCLTTAANTTVDKPAHWQLPNMGSMLERISTYAFTGNPKLLMNFGQALGLLTSLQFHELPAFMDIVRLCEVTKCPLIPIASHPINPDGDLHMPSYATTKYNLGDTCATLLSNCILLCYSWEYATLVPEFMSMHTSMQGMFRTLVRSFVVELQEWVHKSVTANIEQQVLLGAPHCVLDGRREGLRSFMQLEFPFNYPSNSGTPQLMLHNNPLVDPCIPWAMDVYPHNAALQGHLHSIDHLLVTKQITHVALKDLNTGDAALEQAYMNTIQFNEHLAMAISTSNISCLPWGQHLDRTSQHMDCFTWVQVALTVEDHACLLHQAQNIERNTREEIAFRNRQGLADNPMVVWSIVDVPFSSLKSILPRQRAPEEWDMLRATTAHTRMHHEVSTILSWAFDMFPNLIDAVIVARALMLPFPLLDMKTPPQVICHVSPSGAKSYSRAEPLLLFPTPCAATDFLWSFSFNRPITVHTAHSNSRTGLCWWTKAVIVILAYIHPESPLRIAHKDKSPSTEFTTWANTSGISIRLLIKLGYVKFAGTHKRPFIGAKPTGWGPTNAAMLQSIMKKRIDIIMDGEKGWESRLLQTIFTENNIAPLVEKRLIPGADKLIVTVNDSLGKGKQISVDSVKQALIPGMIELEATASTSIKRRHIVHTQASNRIAACLRQRLPSPADSDIDYERHTDDESD